MAQGFIGFLEDQRAAKNVSPYATAPPEHEAFVIGCDLGQSQDFSALSILEKITVKTSEVRQHGFEAPTVVDTTKKILHLRHLQRLKLGTSYPEIVRIVGTIIKALPPARHPPVLVVDATGVGRPVIDMMKQAGLNPIAVTITAGHDENRIASNYRLARGTQQ